MNNETIARLPAHEFFGLQMMALPMRRVPTRAVLQPPVAYTEERPERASRLMLHGRGSPRRNELETFIRDEYRDHFDADVTVFMPTFLALHDADDRICAAVGCRSAALEPLFLEVYTASSIEETIAETTAVRVPRDQIAEIGSLACRDGRAAMAIIRALVPYLIDAGFTWVTFTGADTVVNVLRLLKLEPVPLCAADPQKLGAARHAWGSYYDHSPIVMAGRLLDGVDALASLPGVQ